jgi:cysteinyl-tRNA synthetase
MEWDSPWGRGFPGWHLECSAMSMAYLGESFDIHTGGTDHIPVHHTNEIAQSEGATGKPFVRVWLHGEHLVLGEEQRMGKSEGNIISLQALIDEGYEPLAYRYLALNNHYRSYLNFTWQALKAADTALMGLRRLIREAGAAREGNAPPGAADAPGDDERGAALLADLCDDLNTPKALATLWTALRDAGLPPARKLALAASAEEVLSLGLFNFSRIPRFEGVLRAEGKSTASFEAIALRIQEGTPPSVRELAEQRWTARQAGDFAAADHLRARIAAQGYVVRDRKDGYDLEKAGG